MDSSSINPARLRFIEQSTNATSYSPPVNRQTNNFQRNGYSQGNKKRSWGTAGVDNDAMIQAKKAKTTSQEPQSSASDPSILVVPMVNKAPKLPINLRNQPSKKSEDKASRATNQDHSEAPVLNEGAEGASEDRKRLKQEKKNKKAVETAAADLEKAKAAELALQEDKERKREKQVRKEAKRAKREAKRSKREAKGRDNTAIPTSNDSGKSDSLVNVDDKTARKEQRKRDEEQRAAIGSTEATDSKSTTEKKEKKKKREKPEKKDRIESFVAQLDPDTSKKAEEKASKKALKKAKKSKRQGLKEDATKSPAEKASGSAEQWNPDALSGDVARKQKFFRLLGAAKSSGGELPAPAAASKTFLDVSKMQDDLEKQFDAGVRMKHDGQSKRRGLGL